MAASSNGSQSILDALLTGRFLDDLVFPAKIHQNSTDSFRELLEAAAVGFSNPIPGDLDELIECLEFNKNFTARLTQMAILKIKTKLALVVMLCADDVAPGKFRSRTLRQYMLDTEKFTKKKDTLKQLLGVTELPDDMESIWLEFILPGVTPNEEPQAHGNPHEVAQSSASAAVDSRGGSSITADADLSEKRHRVNSSTDCSGDFAFDLADGWTAPLLRRRLQATLEWRKAGITDPIKYSFRSVLKSPETNIVDILINRSFIDKTQAYKKLLSNKLIDTCWICGPRRFGKSTLLSMFRFILSPLSGISMKLKPMTVQKVFQIIGGLAAGKHFLSMPVRPVLYLSSNNIEVVKDLKTEIFDSFNNACFPASIPVKATKKLNCSQTFMHCWKELRKYWRNFVSEENSDITLRPLILWDEFDYPWRKSVYGKSSREVVEAIGGVLQCIKSVLSECDIIIVTLLRIASTGLSTLNTLEDVMISSDYHDIIGITEQEFSHAMCNSSCQQESFIRICEHLYGHFWRKYKDTREGMFWEWLKLTYNGFRFALYGSTPTLYNPLDLLALSRTVFKALDGKPDLTDEELEDVEVVKSLRFRWLEDISTTFGEVLSENVKQDLLISVLRGGACSKRELHSRLSIDYYERPDYDMTQRLCYELGLLSVRMDAGDYVYISPGFDVQYVRMLEGFGVLFKSRFIPENLSKFSIRGMLSNHKQLFAKLDSCIEMAAKKLVTFSAKFEKMREYAFQDCLYRALLDNMYSEYIQIHSECTINCGVSNRRADFLITLTEPDYTPPPSPAAGSPQHALTSSRQPTVLSSRRKTVLSSRRKTVVSSRRKTVVSSRQQSVLSSSQQALVSSRQQSVMSSSQQALVSSRQPQQAVLPSLQLPLMPSRQQADERSYNRIILELKMISFDDPTPTQIQAKINQAEQQLCVYNKHVKMNGGKKFPVAIIGCWTKDSFTVRRCWCDFDRVNTIDVDDIYVTENTYPTVGTNRQHSAADNSM